MSTVTNVGEFARTTSIRTNADRMTAYQVREFVRAMDAADVPDSAGISAHHSFETRAFVGLSVRVEEVAVAPDSAQGEDGA